MQCRTHPTTSAFNTCNQCGDWLCEECTVDVQGRLYCRGCLMKMATPKPEASRHTKAPSSAPGGRHINWGLLFLFSCFPSGVNYMFMGLIKRGLAALCGFFLLIYFITVSNMPLTLLFSLALPVYFLTCVFDGFNIRRRINAGEAVADNIDEAISLLRSNKYIGWAIVGILGFSVLSIVVGVFVRLVTWLMPILLIVLGLYLLFRISKRPPRE